MRCFIGIPVTGGLLEQCVGLSREMEHATPKHNLHLTLAFLGEQTAAALNRLYDPLSALAREHEPLVQSLHRCEPFPEESGPFIALTGQPCAALARLHQGLRQCLDRQGYRPDARLFRPHITLAKPGVGSALLSARGEWLLQVRTLCLYHSELGGRYPGYEPLARFSLGAGV